VGRRAARLRLPAAQRCCAHGWCSTGALAAPAASRSATPPYYPSSRRARRPRRRSAASLSGKADRIDRRGKDQHSFRSVAEEYLKAKQPNVRPRTFVESVRYLTGGYLKALHGMPVDTVTRKDIASRLTVIMRESGNVTAARVRAGLNAFYVWAMQMGYVEQNPTIGSVKPKDSEGRERVLTDDELAAIWSVCDDRDDYSRIVRLLILTACRRQEVGGIRWSELDADAGTWTIPVERTKNGCEHTLPLPSAAWDIITTVPHVVNRDHLFGIRSQGFKSWGDGKAELDKRLGDSVEPFVLHDIRRTVATMMAEGAEEEEGSDTKQDQSDDGRRLGIEPHIIEAILNHQSGHKAGPAGTYNRAKYRRQIRIPLALWADHVRAPGRRRRAQGVEFFRGNVGHGPLRPRTAGLISMIEMIWSRPTIRTPLE
jgi:integrase